MNLLTLALAALLSAQTPPPQPQPQNSEVEKLKAEVQAKFRLAEELEKATAKTATYAAKIAELQAELDALKARKDAERPVEKAAKAALQKIAPPAVAMPEPAPAVTPGLYRQFSIPEGKITAVANELDLAVI